MRGGVRGVGEGDDASIRRHAGPVPASTVPQAHRPLGHWERGTVAPGTRPG
jgi:hypothetical protein